MLEKVRRNAEQVATELPRRAFFGKVAQAALPVAAAFGGLLVSQRSALALGRGSACCINLETGSICRTPRGQKFCPDGTQPTKCPSGQNLSSC